MACKGSADVVVADINNLALSAARIGATPITPDVSGETAFATVLQDAGPLDIIVINVGILGDEVAIAVQTSNKFERVFQVKLLNINHALNTAKWRCVTAGLYVSAPPYH